MVDVDVLIRDPKGMQAVALRREVLAGGRDAGVSDQHDGRQLYCQPCLLRAVSRDGLLRLKNLGVACTPGPLPDVPDACGEGAGCRGSRIASYGTAVTANLYQLTAIGSRRTTYLSSDVTQASVVVISACRGKTFSSSTRWTSSSESAQASSSTVSS